MLRQAIAFPRDEPRTSNIQHRTPNEDQRHVFVFSVRCWMFDVSKRIPCHLNFLWPVFTTPRASGLPGLRQGYDRSHYPRPGRRHHRIISIGTDLESSMHRHQAGRTFRVRFCRVGWHPSNAHEAPDDIREPLRKLVKHPKSSPSVKSAWIITAGPADRSPNRREKATPRNAPGRRACYSLNTRKRPSKPFYYCIDGYSQSLPDRKTPG